jgi:GNAT superfamily N-acetyltransferase
MTTIEKTDLQGIPVIQAICLKVWPQTYRDIITPAQIEYMLDRMYSDASMTRQMTELGHRFLIARTDGQPSGFASYSPKDGEEGIYRLHKLYVDLSFQGKGVGKQLIDAIVADVVPKGALELELNVNKNNPAKDFYARQGFYAFREEVLDIGEGFVMDDYVLRKKL